MRFKWNGVDYWVSETEATSKKGVRYRKLKFKAKQEAGRQAVLEARQLVRNVPSHAQKHHPKTGFNDDSFEDVPF